jgi:hypothetical protein
MKSGVVRAGDKTAMYRVSLRLGKGQRRRVPLTLLSRIPFLALIALFCRSLLALPLVCGAEVPSIWDSSSGVPLGVARSKSVSVLGSSTRGAPDIALVFAMQKR